MPKFETIKPGDVLYSVTRGRAGNTTMRRTNVHAVHVISVDAERRCALVSWNGNPPKDWYEHALTKLRRSRPKAKPSVFA